MASTEITPAAGAVLEAEWSLLLAACSAIPVEEKIEHLRPLLRKSISWTSLLHLADQHGTSSILYRALSRIEDGGRADEMLSLKRRYQTNLHKCLFLARELIRVLDCLEPLPIEVMPYKGVTLAEAMYGDLAMRQAGDIDLLIRANDFPRIKDALRGLGYTPHLSLSAPEERAYLLSGYECAFDSEAGRNLLEVQWTLLPRFYSVDLDMDDMFQRAVSVTIAGRLMKTPSPEDLMLVLSVHAAKHVWSRLIWLCDIAQIVNLPNLNWDWIANRARTLGIGRILWVTLLLTHRLLQAPLPPVIERAVATDPAALAMADEIGAQVASGTSVDVESMAYFRLMLRLRERKADRTRFLQRLVFTPGPGEWKAVRLPAPLFPLYRLVRLSRLAARLGRAQGVPVVSCR